MSFLCFQKDFPEEYEDSKEEEDEIDANPLIALIDGEKKEDIGTDTNNGAALNFLKTNKSERMPNVETSSLLEKKAHEW